MKIVMLFGVIDVLFSCAPHLYFLKLWRTVIERGGATQPAEVPSEPSETVKEQKKKRCTLDVVFDNVDTDILCLMYVSVGVLISICQMPDMCV